MRRLALLLLGACLVSRPAAPCTIISGTDRNGTTWVGSNEDWFFDFDTVVTTLPREGKRPGAVVFSYGFDTVPQAGVNERGLYFDFNTVPPAPLEPGGWDRKKDFPGGDRALIEHLIRTCRAVPDALALLETYRLGALLEAQLHLADRHGNLAIVNAGGTRVTKGGFAVSTNFDVCTKSSSDEAKACWRYPIAQRLLREKGVGFDTFRSVLEATRQPSVSGTIYSDIVNLRTGDIWLYYGGDLTRPRRLNVRALVAGGSDAAPRTPGEVVAESVARGRKSTLMRTLFPDAPVVKVWSAYLAGGAASAIRVFEELRRDLPGPSAAEVMRHVFSAALFTTQAFADARAFLDAWEAVAAGDRSASYYRALVQLSNGDVAAARRHLATQLSASRSDPVSAEGAAEPLDEAPRTLQKRSEKLLFRLEGKKPDGANVHFELDGYAEARFVGLRVPERPAVFTPLLRTPSGWAGDFVLPPGKLDYAFVVDGRTILDPVNPDSELYEEESGRLLMSTRIVP